MSIMVCMVTILHNTFILQLSSGKLTAHPVRVIYNYTTIQNPTIIVLKYLVILTSVPHSYGNNSITLNTITWQQSNKNYFIPKYEHPICMFLCIYYLALIKNANVWLFCMVFIADGGRAKCEQGPPIYEGDVRIGNIYNGFWRC